MEDQGIFLVIGIQNNHFQVETNIWLFNEGDASSPNSQPGLNRHTVTVVDGLIYHYNQHDGTLHTFPFAYLVGKYVKNKYLIKVEKVYSIQPKYQNIG